ncbi:MAG: methyltransferase domain-containing protein [Planctomycetota bacterium]|nr:methyltransferase domain-containing protein [Planctomycetota bacterium]
MTATATKMPKNKKKKKKNKSLRKGWRTASTSDIHELYELSVQEPEAEVDLTDQVWEEQRGRLATSIREDFCGTAIASMSWVKRRRANTAIAVDLSAEVMDWGKKKVAERLNASQAKQLTFVQDNVLTVETEPVDSVLAMNFSYFLFRTRKELKHYFTRVHHALKDDGLFLLDAYGGSDSFLEMEEDRDLDGFTYIWDQAYYNPISGDVTNHIHFKFPDGTRIDKAFSYHWRLWTLPEIQELLKEAGFRTVHVYWEGTDEDGEGDNEWTISTRGEACEGWIAYIVAGK